MKGIAFFIIPFVVLTGCKQLMFEPEPMNDPEAIFENLWETFETDYAPFELRGVDWQEQYDIYRSQVSPNTTEEELYTIITSMLRSLNDGHVSLVTPGRKVFNSNTYFDQETLDSLFDLDLIKSEYLNGDYTINGDNGNTFGWIGNVGYWHIAWISDNWAEVDGILDMFANADGLIIDMRNNAGGDFTWAYSHFGRLTNQDRITHRSKTKNGPGYNDYTQWYDMVITPKGDYFDKPLVLLTDRYTISAGERTTMAFKSLPNLIHLGDTTNGAHSTKIGKELANGWYYSVSPQIIEVEPGISFEGIGLPPDVVLKNTITEILSGQDKVLEEALTYF